MAWLEEYHMHSKPQASGKTSNGYACSYSSCVHVSNRSTNLVRCVLLSTCSSLHGSTRALYPHCSETKSKLERLLSPHPLAPAAFLSTDYFFRLCLLSGYEPL